MNMTEVDLPLPNYKIEELNDEIIVTVDAPLSEPGKAALVLEGNVFTFDSSPYLLKIKLPHPPCERFIDQTYNDKTKTYEIKFKKLKHPVKEGIFEIKEEQEEASNLQEFLNGEKRSPDGIQNDERKQFYGFGNKYSKMFGRLYNEFSDVINLPDPDNTDVKERRRLRIEEENEKWSEDHYLADTMEIDHLDSIFEYETPWETTSVKEDLCEDEKEILLELNKNSKCDKLSQEERRLCEFQLVDILFGYAYNKRTTEGDNTVESGWTINKLSSTLSWFEVFEDFKAVLISCYTRSLTYPLYRSWDLARIVHKDVVKILKMGPVQVTRCLLEVRDIFNESENRYLLNTLYVNDLCVFSYNMTKKKSEELATEISKLKISKSDLNRDLPLLEMAAHLTLLEEEGKSSSKESGVSDLVEEIKKLDVGATASSDSSGDSSSDSEDSDSDSDSTCSSDNES